MPRSRLVEKIPRNIPDEPAAVVPGRVLFPFGAQEPTPLRDAATFWRMASQVATFAMAIILFGAFLLFSRSLLVPILSALVVALTLGPLVGRAVQNGIPAWIPALGIVLVLGLGLYLAVILLADPASDLIGRSAEIGVAINQKFQILERPLSALRDLQVQIFGAPSKSTPELNSAQILQGLVTIVTPAITEFLLFFATLFFLIVGRSSLRRYLVSLSSTQIGRLRVLKIMNDIEGSLSVYLLTITAINLCLGIVTALAMWAIGLPGPIVWGALAFALNYIPYIGPGIVVISLFFIGLLVFPSLLPALLAPLFFMALTFTEGHFITPNVVGRQMLMNSLAVFLALAFWTWLWGPIGAFLSTPILIMAVVALHHIYPRHKAELPE